MKLTIKQFFTLCAKSILSIFGVGYIKFAPGTFGSIATIPLVIYLYNCNITLVLKILIIIALIIISILLAQYVQLKENLKDPQWIVIDEMIGMLIGSLALTNTSYQSIIALLIVFRILDIKKIWPATYFDSLKHGAGTILDDVISGIYTFFVLLVFGKYFL